MKTTNYRLQTEIENIKEDKQEFINDNDLVHTFVESNIEITDNKSGSEFRGRPLPIYKVESRNIENDDINVYVNIYSGEIMAIRSPQWRIWDLMWGFHIMDWNERDNINNLLLKIFSILALVSSVTGLILFFKLDFK